MNALKLQPIDVVEVLGDSQYPAMKAMLEAYKALSSGSIRTQHAHSLIGTAFVSAMDAYCHVDDEPDEYEQDAYASFIRAEQAAHARELKR